MKAGWEVKALGNFAIFENGDRGKNYPGRKAFVEKGIPFVNAGHLNNGLLDLSEMNYIPEDHFHRLGLGKIKRGDLLFCLRGSLGKFALVNNLNQGAIASSLVIVRPKAGLLGTYLGYYFESPLSALEIGKYANGAAQPNLSAKSLAAFKIPLPPLEEQQRIVAILDEAFEGLDRARANAEANLQNARELFEVYAGKLFENLQKDKSCKIASVEQLAAREKGSIRTGPFGSQLLHSEFVDSGIAVLGIDNAVANDFRWGKARHITPEKYEHLKRYTVKPGDVIITIMGTCGRCAVIPHNVPLAINTKHLACISLNQALCLPEYLHSYFLLSPRARSYLEAQASGSVMDGLNMTIIKEMPVDCPSLELQSDLIGKVDAAKAAQTSLVEAYKSKILHIADLRQSLLQKAFAGELT